MLSLGGAKLYLVLYPNADIVFKYKCSCYCCSLK